MRVYIGTGDAICQVHHGRVHAAAQGNPHHSDAPQCLAQRAHAEWAQVQPRPGAGEHEGEGRHEGPPAEHDQDGVDGGTGDEVQGLHCAIFGRTKGL